MIQDSGDLLPFQIDTKITKAENLNPLNIDQHITANEVKDLTIENLILKLREASCQKHHKEVLRFFGGQSILIKT